MEKMKRNREVSCVDEQSSELAAEENTKRIEDFYKTEELLLNQLIRLKKTEAKQTLTRLMEIVVNHDEMNKTENGLGYLVTISSLVTRYLESEVLTSKKAFSFNHACFRLINARSETTRMTEIAEELVEFFIYALEDKKHPFLAHDTVNKVIFYIDEEVEAPLTVEGLARRFDVSTSHLSRIFKMNTGITLVEYINIRKVEESQYHLRYSDKKISDISNHFNFCNQSYFTRIFKKYTNETPRTFRSSLSSKYFRFKLPSLEKMS
jgi:AraC-like DNA-binding protein